MALVAPALLSANFAHLGEAIRALETEGVSLLHIDISDGHFGPEITVGQPVVASLRRHTRLSLDLRLAIESPERYVKDFLNAGADRLAIHPESTRHLPRLIELIRAKGAKAGMALNPQSPLDLVADLLGEIDFLTIVSADSGVDDQFIPWSTGKVRQAAQRRDRQGLDFQVQVEGGVDFSNIEDLVTAGADILAVGSAIFSEDNPRSLAEMIRLASRPPQTLRA